MGYRKQTHNKGTCRESPVLKKKKKKNKDDECGAKVGNSLAGMNFGNQGYGRNDVAKTVHVGMKFSTPDQDNDQNRRANCAQQDRSGWWFNSCSAANLNGYYHGGKYTPEQTRRIRRRRSLGQLD